MEGKVYLVTLETSYTGEEHHDGTWPIGIFSTIELAEQVGESTLLAAFTYDEENGVFYGEYADEAYVIIRECIIDKPIDTNINVGLVKRIPEMTYA